MNEQKLIEIAQQALLEGKREIGRYYIYTSKIDLDIHLDVTETEMWEHTRKAILESLGYIVVDIVTNDTERGQHTIINHLYPQKVSDETLNFLQLMLGDDFFRFLINKRRIERGISWERSNILFSEILERYGKKEKDRLQIALEEIVGEME